MGSYNPITNKYKDTTPNAVPFEPFKPGKASAGMVLPNNDNLKPFLFGEVYKAKDVSGPLEEFKKMRDEATAQNSTDKSTAQNAVERRFASMGLGGGSVPFQKQKSLITQNYDQLNAKNQNAITTQEGNARRDMQELETQKEYQSQDAMNQRQFAASGQARQEAIQGNQNNFDNATKLRQLDVALYGLEQGNKDSKFNAEMASYQAQNSGGVLGFGSKGIF